jgi:hypothetical protein
MSSTYCCNCEYARTQNNQKPCRDCELTTTYSCWSKSDKISKMCSFKKDKQFDFMCRDCHIYNEQIKPKMIISESDHAVEEFLKECDQDE